MLDKASDDPIAALPFVRAKGKSKGKGRDFWHVKPTRDHDADHATGRRYARQAIEAARADEAKSGDPSPLISWIIRDIAAHRRFHAIEVGFLRELADSATAPKKGPDLHRVESALLDLEGTLAALEIVVHTDCFNRPGREFHALSGLVHAAADRAHEVSAALWPDDAAGPGDTHWRLTSRAGAAGMPPRRKTSSIERDGKKNG